MNIRYFGPIDGHDVKNLARVLRDIKDMQGPKILHLHTIKGKGFGPAEKHATEWHAPGKFDPVTGERFIANTEGMPRFSRTYSEIHWWNLPKPTRRLSVSLPPCPAAVR